MNDTQSSFWLWRGSGGIGWRGCRGLIDDGIEFNQNFVVWWEGIGRRNVRGRVRIGGRLHDGRGADESEDDERQGWWWR